MSVVLESYQKMYRKRTKNTRGFDNNRSKNELIRKRLVLFCLYNSAEAESDPGFTTEDTRVPVEKVSVHAATQIRDLPDFKGKRV